MYRICCGLLLATLATSTGCSLCQNCNDYDGSYYGGRVGDWVHQEGRAGSVYARTSESQYEVDHAYQAAEKDD